MLRVGIVNTSFLENERRVPIYPEHIPWIDPGILKGMTFETGYGDNFGYTDDFFRKSGASIATREEITSNCELVLLPKPVLRDLQAIQDGQTLCGWVHCVQQRDITQTAIDRHLTLIAWEAMHHWAGDGHRHMHVFYKNNEIAGYAAVIHALQLLGMDGHYGPQRRVTVLGFGSVSRGAIYALNGRGFGDIRVLTKRPTHLVADKIPGVHYAQYVEHPNGEFQVMEQSGQRSNLIDGIAESDVVINGVLQDTDHPEIFVKEAQVGALKSGSLIIDISCDKGMGFSFAEPTTFERPTFEVGERVTYYSVDHTPSYLWNAASQEISRALIPYLPLLAKGRDGWHAEPTLAKAIEIETGTIVNPAILRFQGRSGNYPHDSEPQD